MGLFTPAYLSKDPAKREEGFKKLTNDKKLRELINNKSHPDDVRAQAYRRMQELKIAPPYYTLDTGVKLALLPGFSQNELEDVVAKEGVNKVRDAAVAMLRSAESITRLCLRMKFLDIDQPLAYLSDEQLGMIVKKGVSNPTRENARRRIKEPAVLEELALSLSSWEIFEGELILRIVKDITNEAVLKEVYFKAQVPRLKAAIISKLRSPDIIIEVILFCEKNESKSDNLKQLLKKLTALEHYQRVIESAEKESTIKEAIAYIQDEEALYALASAHAMEKIRLAAFHSLRDKKAKAQLAKLAEFASDKGIRIAAVRLIGSQKTLRALYERETDEDVKAAILSTLHKNENEDLFEDLALHDPSARIRQEAVKRVVNPAILHKVIETEKDDAVLQAAILGISDKSALLELLKKTKKYLLRMTIISRLTDRSTLMELAEQTTDTCIHELIISRLTASADKREVMTFISEIEAERDEVGLSGPNFYSKARRLLYDKQVAASS